MQDPQEVDGGPVGDVMVSRSLRTQWRLPNFSQLMRAGRIYESEVFRFQNEGWSMRVYAVDPIIVFLQKEPSLNDCCLEVRLGYRMHDGTFVSAVEFTHTFCEEGERRGGYFPRRVEMETRSSELRDDDLLTIMCCLQVGEAEQENLPFEANSIFGMLPQSGENFGKSSGLPEIVIPLSDEDGPSTSKQSRYEAVQRPFYW